ncbi:uncharacterized protein TNCV_3870321 [Trichonephila clavipes]|nr:uncharacterized protein TNCV_3870321 [Trichonephila clavipes]
MDGSQISCAALRALALNSREQLIREQRKISSEESKARKSNKGNAGLEDPRLKRKVVSNESAERTDKKRSKICRKRSLKGSEHGDQKRPTPEPTQGIKRTVPSSISSRNHKYRRLNNPSQGPQFIAGPSHQIDTRQCKPPTEGSRQGASVQYDRAQETRTTPRGGNSAAERRPVRSRLGFLIFRVFLFPGMSWKSRECICSSRDFREYIKISKQFKNKLFLNKINNNYIK